jgi:hypothetical protein
MKWPLPDRILSIPGSHSLTDPSGASIIITDIDFCIRIFRLGPAILKSMKKSNLTALFLTICASMALPSIAPADILLEYLVKKSPASTVKTQTIVIKNDEIMVKAAGGDKKLDALYRHVPESVVVIDHRKRTLMTVDEAQVDRINEQTQYAQPLLEILGEQVAKLSPDERQKWQKLLGNNFSLDTMAKAAGTPDPTHLVPTGEKTVAGIRCRTMQVMQGATPLAEICLADAGTLRMSEKDAATIRALLGFYERIASKGQRLAGQLGVAIPNIPIREVTGIPVELRDLSREESGSVILNHIKTSSISPELMRIPGDYKAVPLTPWP